jgi:hypothetical protein
MFDWMLSSDRDLYNREMRNLRSHHKSGNITTIRHGKSLKIGGTKLYSMEVQMTDNLCYAYMMIRQSGAGEDAMFTPYFFLTRDNRDRAVAYLNKPFHR